jgi:hypothetical protein
MASKRLCMLLLVASIANAQTNLPPGQVPPPTLPPPGAPPVPAGYDKPANTPVPKATAPTSSATMPTKAAPPAVAPPAAAPTASVSATTPKPAGLKMVPAPLPMLSGMAGDDARTQTEIARMDNQIAVANKRVELFNAEQALTIRQGGARAPSGIPTLIGITGPKTRLTGKFVYDSRSVVYARIGDAMPSGYTLHAITPNNAVLRKGDEQITLTIAYTRELGQPGPFMPSSAAIPVDSAGPIVGRNIAPPTNR